MTDSSLRYHTIDRARLTKGQVARMFALMEANYDCVRRDQFERDLSWKDKVLLLHDRHGEIQGFTTLALNPGGRPDGYDVLYSGDTIIDHRHWGSQELVRGFCHHAGRHVAAAGTRPLYWYLLSKGHRTYLYLHLFTRHFFPGRMPDGSGDGERLRQIADRVSRRLFPAAWRPERGVLQFAEGAGQLKPALADTVATRRHHPGVATFLERNPGFRHGDELVCVARLSTENTRRTARRYFDEGRREAGTAIPCPIGR